MISVYFGSPGSGKTTMAVRELYKRWGQYDYTFSNFGCRCCTGRDDISLAGLGTWTFPPHSYIAIDEAGIEYNNRKFKSLDQATIQWFKLHRHYRCDLSVWSQSWDDMDITLRRLADRLYYIKRLGPFTLIRRVYKRVTVDKQSQQIIDGYKMVSMVWLLLKPLYFVSYAFFGLGFLLKFLCPFDEIQLVLRRPYYKYFDTHAAPPRPVPWRLPKPATVSPAKQCVKTQRWRFFRSRKNTTVCLDATETSTQAAPQGADDESAPLPSGERP